jgi:excinuclease ABC subunit C
LKVCLEFHIGNCKGPCEGLQGEAEYNEMIKEVRGIVKGNISEINKHLKEIMHKYATALDFENAQKVKVKIEALETFQNKSTVVSPTINNVDVFSIQSDEKIGFVNYMRVVNGAIIQAHTVELKKKLDETDEALLAIGMLELRTRYESESKEIIVPFEMDFSIPNSFYTIPQRGDKKKLLELSERNAKFYRLESRKQAERVDPERHSKRILEQMKSDLRLKELPVHIECFDNSNIQGSDPVGACVVFRNAKPAKKDYRHFNIKTVEGPDDFASMEEVVYRRYKRLVDEGESLPQLIVIDGGKGQLSAALKSLEKLDLRGTIAIIGIAKRLEEIYFPGDTLPLYLKKTSESLKVIQQLRNEAHRFGITHHRNRRSKGAIQSELSEIKGIGEKTAKELLLRFKSVKRVKESTLMELEEIVGFSKAKLVFEHFHTEK